jgi:Lrp/AsnC family leucine-responsive transcriptional regulator
MQDYSLIIEILERLMAFDKPFLGELDQVDHKILDLLVDNARISITEMSGIIGLSKTPCTLRMQRLVDEGYIEAFRAVLNPKKLGLDHVAFAEVKLSDTKEKALSEFNRAVRKIKEIEECHMIAGRFDYLLKVRTADIRKYREVLGEKISSLPHVASTSTSVAMESVKESGR